MNYANLMDPISEKGWEDLPTPLLELILESLPIPDYLRFAAVCTSWRDVQDDHRRDHTVSPRYKRQMPWLFLPQDKQSPQQLLCYNSSEQTYYRITLSEEKGKLFLCGSSYGWLIFLDNNNNVVFIVNPFTSSEFKIPVPNTELPNGSFRPLGVLSSVPTEPDCLVLLWDSANACHFSCCVTKKAWTRWNVNPVAGHFTYPVICRGEIFYMPGPSLQDPPLVLDYMGLPVSISQWRFLTESDGKVLWIRITWKEDGKHVERIDVWEVDVFDNVRVKLKSLGDRVIFLCRGNSLAMSSADTEGPGNRIYLTWKMIFSAEEDQNQRQMWIQYDYGSHLVISSKLQEVREHGQELLRDDPCYWLAPNLL